jgi:hypothetical protein
MIDMLEADMRENGPGAITDGRPALLGFDPVVSQLHTLTNQIISMRIEQGNNIVKHMKGPLLPMEIVEERMRKYTAHKRADAISAAQSKAKWREMTDA